MSYLRVTVDGTVVTHDFDPTTLEIPTRADMGEANSGSLLFEDEGATLTLTGHQSVVIEEVDSTQPRIFTGWTAAEPMAVCDLASMSSNWTLGPDEVTRHSWPSVPISRFLATASQRMTSTSLPARV